MNNRALKTYLLWSDLDWENCKVFSRIQYIVNYLDRFILLLLESAENETLSTNFWMTETSNFSSRVNRVYENREWMNWIFRVKLSRNYRKFLGLVIKNYATTFFSKEIKDGRVCHLNDKKGGLMDDCTSLWRTWPLAGRGPCLRFPCPKFGSKVVDIVRQNPSKRCFGGF